MHSSVSVSVRCLLLAGAGLVAAQAGSSEVNCLTQIGPQPVSVIPTVTAGATSTVSLPATTVTTAVTETTTAAALTQTDTTTVEITTTTTEDAVTETFTSTSTSTETTTTTTTQTATTTSTVNTVETTTSTSVIAAPSGFVPIADTQNGYPARKRDSHRRHCHKATLPKPSVYPTPIAGTYSAAQSSPSSSSSSSSSYATTVPCSVGEGTQYPTAVECSATTTTQLTSTETQTSSSTVTPVPSTTLVTETVTSTSTEVPRASTTLTLTETTTATETDTQTTTVTETATSTSIETVTPTTYAACQANNILTNYQGQAIVNVFNRGRGSATVYDYSQANNPEECCVQCIRKAGCTGTIFGAGSTYCLLMYADGRTCASQSSNLSQFVTNSGTASAFILSNGACGYQQWVAGS